MTKSEASKIRKTIPCYSARYISKSGQLYCKAYSYINDKYDPVMESERIKKILDSVPENLRSTHSIKRITYQGFIHDTDVVFQ